MSTIVDSATNSKPVVEILLIINSEVIKMNAQEDARY